MRAGSSMATICGAVKVTDPAVAAVAESRVIAEAIIFFISASFNNRFTKLHLQTNDSRESYLGFNTFRNKKKCYFAVEPNTRLKL